MAAKKTKQGKSGGSGKDKSGQSSLEARVAALESRQGLSHETQDFIERAGQKGKSSGTASSRAFKSVRVLSADAVAPAQLVDVTFDLSSTPKAPGMVRLYLAGTTADIASSTSPHGVLPRQIVGSDIQLIMDITGNSGEAGSFNVKGALPSSISLNVDDGPTSIKYLHVTG
jgi:hypothetical protein